MSGPADTLSDDRVEADTQPIGQAEIIAFRPRARPSLPAKPIAISGQPSTLFLRMLNDVLMERAALLDGTATLPSDPLGRTRQAIAQQFIALEDLFNAGGEGA